MELIRWIGFGAFLLSSSVIGVRLLAVARRTGQIPELLIGVGVLGMGPLGYGLAVVSHTLAGSSVMWSAVLRGSAMLSMNVGAIAQYLVICLVFRPRANWARVAMGVATASLIAAYAGEILENGLLVRDSAARWESSWYRLGAVMRLGCLAWSAAESLHYFGRMRRRDRLGLGDPIVTNRFLLWGLGAGAAAMGVAFGLSVRAVTGVSATQMPLASLVVSAHGLVAAIGMWLAFMPPAFYLRFVGARSERAHAQAA